MDKLKNLLKSDTPTDQYDTSRTTQSGKLTGQGSHFPGKEEGTAATSVTGTTVSGTEPQTRGPPDVSAAPTSSTAAATTAGPEQTGSSHINTTSAASTEPTTQTSEPTFAKSSAAPGPAGDIKDYSVASADFPKTQTSTDGSGSAAIGQTSTYSSSHLKSGDPTSSIVDPASSDPLTYKKPESGSHATEAGVGAGAAATAASLAFAHGEERKKSEMAGYENPYRASSLDPRVDGLSKTSAEAATAESPVTSTTGTSHEPAIGAGAGLASAGAASAFSGGSKPHTEAAAPSSLTSTVNPVDRSAEYSAGAGLTGLSSGTPPTASSEAPVVPTGTATSAPTEAEIGNNRQSVVGKVLGAVGLGGMAGALGAGAASSKDSSAVAATPEQPTTTTGLDSYTSSTQQGPPPSHHRKESIPTTAYPSGTFDSPRAINAPIGGAGSPVVHGDQSSHTGRDVAAGAAVGTAAAGAATVGAHEYEQSKALREGISGEPHGTAPALKEPGNTTALSGVDSSHYNDSQNLRGNITEQPSVGMGTFHDATTLKDTGTSSQLGTGIYGSQQLSPDVGATTSRELETGGYGEPTATTSTSSYLGTGGFGAAKATEPAATGPAETVPPTTAPPETVPTTTPITSKPKEDDHTTRDTAIGAGAGAAAVGAGAYGAHEYSKREAEKAEAEAAKEQAAREKELARQKAAEQAAHDKELEKQHKAEEKAAAKEEKKHQKELAKEEKQHEKELEKERREKEKEEARLRKKQEEEEEDQRNREQRERLAAATGIGAAGGAAAAAGEEEKEKEMEKEKKPSIFKRIFKRRKNKDTGEDEDYESEEEDKTHPTDKAATAAYGSAVVGGGLAADDKHLHESSTTSQPSTATAQGEGHHADPAAAAAYGSAVVGGGLAADDRHLQESSRSSHPSTTAVQDSAPRESITGLPYDSSKDPAAAERLGEHTHGTGIGTFDKEDAAVATAAPTTSGTYEQEMAPSTMESTGTPSHQPVGAITGSTAATTAHEKSVSPAAVESTGTHTQQPTGAVTGLPHDTSKTTEPTTHTDGYQPSTGVAAGEVEKDRPSQMPAAEGMAGLPAGLNTNFTLGEIQDKHANQDSSESRGGLGERIKEALHIGGSQKKEDE